MKKLSTIIIIIGLLIGIIPIVGSLYTRWNESRILEEWYNSVDVNEFEESEDANPEESYEELLSVFAPGTGNTSEADDNLPNGQNQTDNDSDDGGSQSQSSKESNSKPKYTIIGTIEIDKIKIKYPILEGVSSSDLSIGIGHIPGTAGLGKLGNSALAGHRNYTFGRFFNRLDEIGEGDTILISTKKAEFKYRVYKKHVVTPDDVSVIKGTKDDSILTLITCTPIYKATHRLIVHARLEESILFEP